MRNYGEELIKIIQTDWINTKEFKEIWTREHGQPMMYCSSTYDEANTFGYTKFTELLEEAISNGFDINVPLPSESKEDIPLIRENMPLICHALYDKKGLQYCKALIDKGADINARDAFGNTPLMIFLKKVSNYYCNPYISEPELMNLLIEKCADINAQNNDKVSALRIAVRNNKFRIAKKLIKKGADINQRAEYGDTLAVEIADSRRSGYSQKKYNFLKYLLEQGTDINAKDHTGANLLIKCSSYWQYVPLELYKEILDKTDDVNALTVDKESALGLLCHSYITKQIYLFPNSQFAKKFNEKIEMLLEAGADPSLYKDSLRRDPCNIKAVEELQKQLFAKHEQVKQLQNNSLNFDERIYYDYEL